MANRKTATKKEKSPLAKAVDFVSAAQKSNGLAPYQHHCRFTNGYVVASDGQITMGYPCAVEVDACPQTKILRTALNKITGDHVVTVEHNNSGELVALKIKDAKLSVNVPCIPSGTMPALAPDMKQADIPAPVGNALFAVAPLAAETSDKALYSAVLLRPGSAVSIAPGGVALAESWHGEQMPPNGLALPKAFVAIMQKVGLPTGLGVGQGSATFWYDDGSFIKTQLYDIQIPSKVDDVVSDKSHAPVYVEYTDALKEAIETGLAFAVSDFVRIDKDVLRVFEAKVERAAVPLAPLNVNVTTNFNAKLFLLLAAHADSVCFDNTSKSKNVYFKGEGYRAVLAGGAA